MKTSIEEADGIAPDFPPYPLSVSAGGFVFLSGLRGSAPSEVGGFSQVPEAVGARAQGFAAADLMEGRLTCDAWRTHERLNAVLAASGSAGDLILRQHIWQSEKAYFPAYEQVRKTMQPAPAPSSGVGVRSLVANDAGLIGIDGIAACPAEGPEHGPVTITTLPGGRPSTAHYSQSLSYGPLLFLAGHIPIDTRVPSKPLVTTFDALDPADRFLEMGRSHTDTRQSPIAVQSVFAYREIERHLTELGHALNDIVHVTVFLQRTSDYAVFHRVHRHFFSSEGPSLTVTGFDEVGHKGTLIEIEPTVLRKGTWKRDSIGWAGVPLVAAPAASLVGDLVYFSGMTGLDREGRLVRSAEEVSRQGARLVRLLELTERQPGMAAQCWTAWQRLYETMEAASVAPKNLMKVTLYIADPADLAVHEIVRQQFISSGLPAFECVCVPNPGGIPGAHVQIEAIGIR